MEVRMKNPIAKLREKKRMTQRELASWLRVSAAFVSALEAGASAPSEKTLKKIGEIFFIDARKLEKALIRFREERRKEIKQKLGRRTSRK